MEKYVVTDSEVLACLEKLHDITHRVVLPARERAIKHMEEIAALNRNGAKQVAGTPEVLHSGESSVCSGNNGNVPVRPAPGMSPASFLPGDADAGGVSGLPK